MRIKKPSNIFTEEIVQKIHKLYIQYEIIKYVMKNKYVKITTK